MSTIYMFGCGQIPVVFHSNIVYFLRSLEGQWRYAEKCRYPNLHIQPIEYETFKYYQPL